MGRHISRLPDFNSNTRSFCLHYPTKSCKVINSLGGEVASAFFFFFLHVITVAKMTSGKFKAEGNAIEVDNDSTF